MEEYSRGDAYLLGRVTYEMLWPGWSTQTSVDISKPATTDVAAETSEFYFVASSVRKSVRTLVRQLRGPHLSTCA